MLSDVDSLLDEVIEVLGDLRSQAVLLQDSQDLIACDSLNLGNTEVVSQNDTNLGRRCTLLGQLDDLLNQVVSGDLNPAGRSASERKTSASNTLAV